ncbi:unnamed protein product [Paramecium sonneborni]|uniref:Uncharacterized protein n=1 Tax=Paramecium sonneborni TaxID=65129 RepID=A0A8S1LFX5_9CILI|nr:unnamed protein product [Paramecium sonneborni]
MSQNKDLNLNIQQLNQFIYSKNLRQLINFGHIIKKNETIYCYELDWVKIDTPKAPVEIKDGFLSAEICLKIA